MSAFEDDPAVRAAGRLAALALARACAEAMVTGQDIEPGSAVAAHLFLAGRPDNPAGPAAALDVPDEVVWLLGASAQVCAAVLYRLAAVRAGRDPGLADVMAVCDELEAGLVSAG